MAQNPWDNDPIVQQPRGRIYAPPPTPVQAEKDAVGIENTRTNTAKNRAEIQNDGDRIRLDKQKLDADLYAKGLRINSQTGGVEPIPGWKPPVAPSAENVKVDRDRAARLQALARQINRTQELYNQDIAPEPLGWLSSAGDYLPSDANARFDVSGAQLSEKGLSAFKVPGTGQISDRDSIMFDRANLPTASTRDVAIEEQLRGVRERVDEELKALGLDPVQWVGSRREGAPLVGPGTSEVPPASGNMGGPAGNGGGGSPVQMGLSRGESFTTDADLAIAAAVNAAINRPGVTVQDLVAAAQQAGGQITPSDLAAFQSAVQARQQGKPVTFNPQATGRRNPLEVAAGNALMNPAGTAAATAVSGLGLNTLDGVLPDQMQALRGLNPNMAALGDIAGAIGGTAALGKVGSAAVKAAAPSLAPRILSGGGRAGQLARNLAGDTVFGATYGANVEGDAGFGAAQAAGGSLAGNLAGGVVGRALGGLQRLNPAQYLQGRGVDLTIGQQLGGAARTIEDAATSVPGIGDMINARRGDSIIDLNRAAFNEVAGQDIGYGKGAVDTLLGADGNRGMVSQAYDSVLAGRQFDLTDPVTQQGMVAARNPTTQLMPDHQVKFDTAMTNRVDPVMANPTMTGEQYQQVQRGLTGYKGARGADGFEDDYRDAIGGVQSVLRDTVDRQAPDLTPALRSADSMNRGARVLESAVDRARKDTLGLGEGVFNPGHLTDAVSANGKKFSGRVPLEKLAAAAQNIIPSKLPDSGTGRRIMQGALGSAVLGGAAGASGGIGEQDPISAALSGSADGSLAGLGIYGLLAAGGTKAGQKALTKALIDRPEILRDFGSFISKQRGLLGSAAVPLFIEAGN